MSKLIYANFSRLKKDLCFWLCMGFMAAAGLFVALKSEVSLDRVFFSYTLIIGLVSAVFIGLFIGTEHGDGTMRNKLIVGHSKLRVYLANLIVCVVSGFAFCGAFMVPMLAVGIPRLGYFDMGSLNALMLLGVTLALSMAFSALLTLIAMLSANKALTAVFCIVCFIALIGAAAFLNSALQEPEFIDSYVTTVTGTGEMLNEANPNYLTGEKREVYQFFFDLIPTGQAFQFVEMSMVNTGLLPVYSLLIFLLSSIIGVAVFKKKRREIGDCHGFLALDCGWRFDAGGYSFADKMPPAAKVGG